MTRQSMGTETRLSSPIRIGIDGRLLLRPLRGMPLYAYRLALMLPEIRPKYNFVFFINRGFEHNDKPNEYEQRLHRICQSPNLQLVNADDDGEQRWEQLILPRLLREHGIALLHMPGNRICWGTDIPQVVTVHDTMEYDFLSEIIGFPQKASLSVRLWVLRKRAYVWWLYRHGIKRAHAVITVSSASARDVTHTCRIHPDRVRVIHHGVDPEFAPDDRCSTGVETRKCCLMLGGDSYQKNPQAGIRAWCKLPSDLRKRFPLVIVGATAREGSSLFSEIAEHRAMGEIIVHRWLPQHELVSLFQTAGVFIFPSRREGFGFPVLQAMASGTPVVCSRAPALDEIAGCAALKAEAEDIAGLSDAIRALLTDEQLWRFHRIQGLAHAQKFRWFESAERHANVYDSLLSGNVPAGRTPC